MRAPAKAGGRIRKPSSGFGPLCRFRYLVGSGQFCAFRYQSQGAIRELSGGLASNIDGGLRLTPKGVTAEGDRVAVEAEAYEKMKTGHTYQNPVSFPFVVRDGKIQQVKGVPRHDPRNEVLCA
jgi:hypothetical protein